MHNFKEEKESNMHLVGGLIRTSSHESCMGLGFRDLGFSLVANIYIYILLSDFPVRGSFE